MNIDEKMARLIGATHHDMELSTVPLEPIYLAAWEWAYMDGLRIAGNHYPGIEDYSIEHCKKNYVDGFNAVIRDGEILGFQRQKFVP